MELKYLVFTRMPVGVTQGDSGLCSCVHVTVFPALIISLCLLSRRSRPRSVSHYDVQHDELLLPAKLPLCKSPQHQ